MRYIAIEIKIILEGEKHHFNDTNENIKAVCTNNIKVKILFISTNPIYKIIQQNLILIV